jgi:hypothetical protein
MTARETRALHINLEEIRASEKMFNASLDKICQKKVTQNVTLTDIWSS